MLVSTFELLLKPQLPKLPGLSAELTENLKNLSRTVFKAISNYRQSQQI